MIDGYEWRPWEGSFWSAEVEELTEGVPALPGVKMKISFSFSIWHSPLT